MDITINTNNKQLVLQLTDQEFESYQLFEPAFLSKLANRLSNVWVNELTDYKETKKGEIEQALKKADAVELVQILDLLRKSKPQET